MADTTQTSSGKKASKKSGVDPHVPGKLASDIDDPDAFQGSMIDFWGWIEKNSALFSIVIAVALLAGIGWAINSWWSGRQERSAQDAYYAAEAKFSKLREGFDRAKYKALMPMGAQDKSAGDQAASGDLNKDYGSVMGDLEKVAREHAGTSAGAQAAILASETYLSYGQPDKAVELASLSAGKLGPKTLLGDLSRVLWGTALASKGACGEAVKIWQQVLDNQAAVFLHGDVSLRSGLCYESMNDFEKAKEMYLKVTSDSSDSAAAMTAKGLLRAIDMKAKPATAAAPAKG